MIDPGRNTRQDINFSPVAADPTAKAWHGSQLATFDGTKKAQGKLVVTMGGIGNGPHTGGVYQYAAGRGFHMLAVDMYNSEGGESNQGKVYLESFAGEDVTPVAEVSPANSVRGRIKKGLAYLETQDPGADWGFFLDAQGEVRWQEVILFGYSYGGQVALAATKYVAPYRVFLTASPTLPADAAWLTGMPNVADVKRCFALNSSGDEAKFAKLTTAGWVGTPQTVMDAAYKMLMDPPFMNSSMLVAPGGHTEFCSVAGNRYDVICDFVFDVKK
jgi:dienelactone hydrolase